MKFLIVATALVVASVPANEPEMVTVRREYAEFLVKENLRLQKEAQELVDGIEAQHRRIQQLQSATNCV